MLKVWCLAQSSFLRLLVPGPCIPCKVLKHLPYLFLKAASLQKINHTLLETITTLHYLGTMASLNETIKDKDKPVDRQGAVYKIECCDCQASYIGETSRNLSTRLTEHKRATRNGDVNNHIAEHHLKTKHQIDWDSATCITYSTDYYQRLTLESWFTNLEQMPLNRSQQLPAPYKRLIDEIKQN